MLNAKNICINYVSGRKLMSRIRKVYVRGAVKKPLEWMLYV